MICIGTLKDSFILKHSYYGKLKKLTPTEIQQLIFAIFDYEIEQKEPNFDANARLDTIFEFVKDDLDKNRTNYDRRCETSRWNGLFGGRPKKEVQAEEDEENLKKPKKPKNPICNDRSDMTDMTDIKKENRKKKKDDKRKDIVQKQEYGTYKHVLLTQKEYESLTQAYQCHTRHIIEFFDSYIEEKGYKSKSHYLAIKRWVVDAYMDKLQKAAQRQSKQGMVPKWFDKKIECTPLTEAEEKELETLLRDF